MSNIPDSWMYALLSEVAFIQMGQSPNSRSYNEIGEGLPFFQGKADFGSLYPTVRKWCTEPTKTAEAGEILLSVRAPVGPTNLAPERCCIGRGLASIQAVHPFNQKYLLHFFRNIESWLSQQGTGTTFAGIGSREIRQIEVPVAPVNEQSRIADKLDGLIARVNSCHDRLANIDSILKIIRQSIFDVATSGEFARHWVCTDRPAIWQEGKVEDLLVDKPRNGYSPRAVNYETDVRSLSLTATTSGYFDPQHIKYIDECISEDSHLWLEPGDILIQRANSLEHVGVSAVYDGPSKGYIYPDLMMKCRANSRVLTDYLYYLLSSSSVRSYFRKNATGTTGNMPKINQKIVLSAPVSIPSIDEQREIVRRVKMLLAHVERLELYYECACSKISKILSSLLSKAFIGELVPQHLNDEPTSDLLERISLLKEKTDAKVSKVKRSKKTTSNIKSNLNMLKREDIQPDHLSAILRKSGSMQPESLWSSSQLEIDEFYEQLKEEEEKGLLSEIINESEDASRLLEAI